MYLLVAADACTPSAAAMAVSSDMPFRANRFDYPRHFFVCKSIACMDEEEKQELSNSMAAHSRLDRRSVQTYVGVATGPVKLVTLRFGRVEIDHIWPQRA